MAFPEKTPRLAVWLQSIRAYSFPATLIPVLVSLSIAKHSQVIFVWEQVALLCLGLVSLHAGTNLVNDYYDFQHGQDTKKTFGSSRVLVDGLLSPVEVRHGIIWCYTLALCCAAFFLLMRGLPLAILVSLGFLGSYVYTGGPWALKYHALGELAVFILLGPLLFSGISLALTGTVSPANLAASLLIGPLSAAVLTANNLRDFADDRSGGISTIVTWLGRQRAGLVYAGELLLPYVLTMLLFLLKVFPLGTLIVLATLPLALLLLRKVIHHGTIPELLVENTAKLLLPFGLLLALGFISSGWTA